MAFTRSGGSHDALSGVSASDHHVATVGGDINHADLANIGVGDHHTAPVNADFTLAGLGTKAHVNLSDAPADAHHAEGHTIASHSDTTATGAEIESLTDGSEVALHEHSGHARIASGTYTGDGALSQAITGIGFAVRFVMITIRVTGSTLFTDRSWMLTTDVIVDDGGSGVAASLDNSAGRSSLDINTIISVDSDGFTVDDEGADTHPNTLNQVYNFFVLG